MTTDQRQGTPFDLGLHGVQSQVSDDEGLGQRHIAADHRIDSVHDLGLGQTTHTDHFGRQLPQLGGERTGHGEVSIPLQ